MKIVSGVVSGVSRLARINADLSKEASKRLKWFDYYGRCGHNARLTCRHFGISPPTFYRWKRRYDPKHLESLRGQSHRPRRLRRPSYSAEMGEAVVKLREEYPRWGKDKLVILLPSKGYRTSASTVGRILRYAKQRRLLKETAPNYVSARKRSRQRPYATRKPKDYLVRQVGDIVQLDTLDLRPLPGVLLKHFTAHDVVSKWNVISIHRQASAATATHFLDILGARMPFPVRAHR